MGVDRSEREGRGGVDVGRGEGRDGAWRWLPYLGGVVPLPLHRDVQRRQVVERLLGVSLERLQPYWQAE